MSNKIFPIRMDDEDRKRLESQSRSRGIPMAALIKEKLAMGLEFPPYISMLINSYAKGTGLSTYEIVKRIILWFFAQREAELKETGEVDQLLPMFSYSPDEKETDEQLFERLVKGVRQNWPQDQE